MVLGRLIVALDAESLSPIPKKWMTKVFVLGDVIAFLGQAAGMSCVISHLEDEVTDSPCRWRNHGQRNSERFGYG